MLMENMHIDDNKNLVRVCMLRCVYVCMCVCVCVFVCVRTYDC